MTRKIKILLVVSPIILVLDHLTKWLIVKKVPLGSKIVVWENFFDIVHTRNTGAAFGILADWSHEWRNPFFYLVSAIAVVFLIYFLRQIQENQKGALVSIALIFGGALGNLSDRIFRGSVVDFLSFHWYDQSVNWNLFGWKINFDLIWPAFNVADSAITVGVFWLLIAMGRIKK